MISIIIPAYNEEKYLEKTFQSIAEQSCQDYETIVVANGCTDGTIEIAKQHADRLFVVDKPHVSIARNIGAQHAQGNMLIFLDADTRLAPNALAAISIFDGAVATVPSYPNSPKFHFYLLNAIKNMMHKLKLHKGSSGVIITSKQLFNKAGGFDNTIIRENSRFIKKLSRFGTYKFVSDTYAITSTRRYEKWGLVRTMEFWLVNFWKHDTAYEPIR